MKLPSLSKVKDAESLIKFHERLLFFRAYPPSGRVLREVESILKETPQQVSQLQETDIDLSPLDEVDVSGIAETVVTSNFSYAIVRWLVKKYPKQVSIDWGWFD